MSLPEFYKSFFFLSENDEKFLGDLKHQSSAITSDMVDFIAYLVHLNDEYDSN